MNVVLLAIDEHHSRVPIIGEIILVKKIEMTYLLSFCPI